MLSLQAEGFTGVKKGETESQRGTQTFCCSLWTSIKVLLFYLLKLPFARKSEFQSHGYQANGL